MAGGSGTRFWPKSRQALPKQFLNILGDKSMLQMTMTRLLSLTGKQNITIVGNKEHASLLAQQVKGIADARLVLEPVGRNTAACITTVAFLIAREDPEGILVILPADHWIPCLTTGRHRPPNDAIRSSQPCYAGSSFRVRFPANRDRVRFR